MQRPSRLIPALLSAVHQLRAELSRLPDGPVVPVWDIATRGFHWLLVAAVLVAGVTGFISGMPALGMHLIAGITIALLVGFRLVWGVLGPTYARFANFAFAPRSVLNHVQELCDGHGRRHVGHNPLGAMMVFALLGVLTMIVLTGVIALGGMFKQGPLAAFASFAAGWRWLGVHQALAVALLMMLGLHLAGVMFETLRARENLVAAMITGAKSADPPGCEALPRRGHPIVAAAITLVLAAIVTWGVTRLSAMPTPLPPATLDPAYAEQCGACHVAYSPSLNPTSVWNAIMADLGHHFGQDASLSAAHVAQIRAYLDANSAEHWDTLPANRLRLRDPADPLRITATPFWRHMHASIPARVFASRAVGSRGACDSCHRDAATGRFAPQLIEIPEDAE